MAYIKSYISILLGIISIFQLTAASVVVTDIRNKRTLCDYLIISPSEFQRNATVLAEHRNNFNGDDVENARVVSLESIYDIFTTSDTLQNYEIIWYGLKWMYENWEEPFKYLVLVGDDSLVFNEEDSLWYGYGRMPTFIENTSYPTRLLKYSDDWYATLQCSVPTAIKDSLYGVPLAIGRIPCETGAQCSLYVSKIITFDESAPRGPWRNKAVLAADDQYQGNNQVDYIQHYSSLEEISNLSLEDYQATKCFLARFPKDNNGLHTEAKKYFFQHINEGTLWAAYYGHGNAPILADEMFLTVDDCHYFSNTNTPIVFSVFTSSNGAFHYPFKKSMCKQFLFIPEGGCIIYIANPATTFASANAMFGNMFFNTKKSNPSLSIGKLIFKAKTINPGLLFNPYSLLGDPALIFSQGNAELDIALDPQGKIPTKIICTVASPTAFSGSYYCTFASRDSIVIPAPSYLTAFINDSIFDSSSGNFSSSFEVPIPAEAYNRNVKFIAYVWNDQFDGRADTIVNLDMTPICDPINGINKNKGFAIRLMRNILSVNYNTNSSDPIKEIALFNIKGKKIFSRQYNTHKNVVTIDFNKSNIAAGKYVVQVKTKHELFNKRLVYMK